MSLSKFGGGGGGVGSVGTLNYLINDGGVAISPTTRQPVELAFTGKIVRWILLADVVGDITVDLWKSDYAGYPPNVGGSITGGNPPTMVAADKAEDSALAGWAVDFVPGDILLPVVTLAAAVEKVTLALEMERTA